MDVRTKIKLAILSVILILFTITGIVYIVTLRQYVLDNNKNQTGTVAAEEYESAEKPVNKEPDPTAKPSTKITDEEKYPKTYEGKPTEKPKEDIPEKQKEPSFKEINEIQYADEITTAYKTYLSDTTYVAVMKEEINGNPYCIAHVIIDDAKQLKTIITAEKRYTDKLYDDNNTVLAMNASMLKDNHTDFIDGLHICNYNVIGNVTISTGNELAYDNTGCINKLEKNISLNDIKLNNIQWTILSTCPALIENSKAVELKDNIHTKNACKSAIGMVKPGEYYLIVASDGDYISDITYEDIQEILINKSCTFAQALSAGVNVVMSMQGELINKPAAKTGRPQYEYLIVSD